MTMKKNMQLAWQELRGSLGLCSDNERATIIGAADTVHGDIESNGDLIVLGTVKGNVSCDGILWLKGTVTGQVFAAEVNPIY